jgi:hypothetical protein
VQHAPFPDIMPELNDSGNTQSVAHFDSTFANSDNNPRVSALQIYSPVAESRSATEYISGTTQNPLVMGLNETTNVDKRIFWQ